MSMRKQLVAVLFGCTVILGGSAVAQDTYPNRPIKVVVGYPPGGFPDTMARIFGERIGRIFNQAVIIENRPSAGTLVAGDAVARSAPDGYTLLAADSQMWGISSLVYKSMPFDALRDFEPVSMMATTSNFLIVSTTFPEKGGFKEVVAHLKANPGKYRYGTAGIGSLHHITLEMFKARTGVDIEHLPFKGGSQILPAIAAGEVSIAVQSLAALPAYVKQGKVRILGLAGAKRSTQLPDVPTLEELGVADMDFLGSMGFLMPKGTPKPIIERFAAAVKQASQDPELLKRLEHVGVDSVSTTPGEMAQWMKNDVELYKKAGAVAQLRAE